ncbi:MAG TPA: hypothetical protein VGH56_04285, partial [Solirubrobacteraceae bacterium]
VARQLRAAARDPRVARPDEEQDRLRELRGSLPGEVVVTAAAHPLAGRRLPVEGRRRVGGVPCLIVRLGDGTAVTIAMSATSAWRALTPGEAGVGAVLSAGGLRRLRGLLEARAVDGSGT